MNKYRDFGAPPVADTSSFENTNSSFENTNSSIENTNSSFQNTNSSFQNTNSSFQNSGGHFAKYWGAGGEIHNMYAFGVRLRYANLSNIILDISNSLFDILL